MKHKIFMSTLVIILFSVLLGCSQSPFPGFDKAKSGLYYKFYTQNADSAKPAVSDIVDVKMRYSLNDSILFDSKNMPQQMRFPLMEPEFQGDFYEGLAMMAAGDSASFLCRADSIFIKVFKTKSIPSSVKPGDMLQFDIKMNSFQTAEAYQAERMKKMEAERQLAKEKLDAYIAAQNITQQPIESGLYYLETLKGKGPQAKSGQKVKVHYKGTLTDGTKFDSSFDRGEPIEFVLGQGRVIKGWDEGIAMMRKGGKATLVIPYQLGYGERGVGSIPAFSPLVFEVELVDIIK